MAEAQTPDTYTTAAYFLRKELNTPDEAAKFLHEGIRNNPGSYELLYELGRLYHENYHDEQRARNPRQDRRLGGDHAEPLPLPPQQARERALEQTPVGVGDDRLPGAVRGGTLVFAPSRSISTWVQYGRSSA